MSTENMRNFDPSIFISWSGPLKPLALRLQTAFSDRDTKAVVGAEEPPRTGHSYNDYFPARIITQLLRETTHAVILLMPDFQNDSRYYFRDNVMFEVGFLFAYLPSQSIFFFTIDTTHRDVPSDVQGVEITCIPHLTHDDFLAGTDIEGKLKRASEYISEQVRQKIDSSIHNKVNLSQPILVFSQYSNYKAFLRTQIDSLQGPNVTRFASTLLCIATASVYADENDLLYEWCKDAITRIKTTRWQSYVMIAQNILEFYKQSDELTKIPLIQKLQDLLDTLRAWERAHGESLLHGDSKDVFIYVYAQNYKQHLLRRIAQQREDPTERDILLNEAWDCLEGMISVLEKDREYFSDESKWLWLGFAYFQRCRCWYDMKLPADKEALAKKSIGMACDLRVRMGNLLESRANDIVEKRLAQNYKLETVTNHIFRMKHWPGGLEKMQLDAICELLRSNMPDNSFWRRTHGQVQEAIPHIIRDESAQERFLNDLDSMVIRQS